jgi:hypothetical protein
MSGHGVWAELLHQRVEKAKRRFGLDGQRVELDFTQFRRPRPAEPARQGELF